MRLVMSSVGFSLVASVVALSCKTSTPLDGRIDGKPLPVVEIVKGDELVIEHDGRKETVRLLGVHAFAAGADAKTDALAAASTKALGAQLLGKEVTLTTGEPRKDSYGRHLAYVQQAGADVNRRMLEEGSAVVYTEFAFEREADYLSAEKAARQARRGLWADAAASSLVVGLRKQWAEARAKFVDRAPAADELLVAEPEN